MNMHKLKTSKERQKNLCIKHFVSSLALRGHLLRSHHMHVVRWTYGVFRLYTLLVLLEQTGKHEGGQLKLGVQLHSGKQIFLG